MKTSLITLIIILFTFSTAALAEESYTFNTDDAKTYLENICYESDKIEEISAKKSIKRIEGLNELLEIVSICNLESKVAAYQNLTVPYKDIDSLSDREKSIIKAAYAFGITENSEYITPNRILTRLDLLRFSLKVYGIPLSPLLLNINYVDFSDLSDENDDTLASIARKIGFAGIDGKKFYPNKKISGNDLIIWLATIDRYARTLVDESFSKFTEDDETIDTSGSYKLSDDNISEIVEMWNLIKDYSVSPEDKAIDYTKLEEAMLQGMFDELNKTVDPYSYYVPQNISEMRDENEYYGIGASLAIATDSNVYFDTIFRDSPAEKAGLKSLDVIKKVNDTEVKGMSTNDVAMMIRGEEGTTVKLLIYRESKKKEFTVNVKREKITLTLVDSEVVKYLNQYFLYSHIGTFNKDGVIDIFEEHLTKALESGNEISGIVIDLRGNGGGKVSEVIKLIEDFIPNGSLAFSFQYKGDREETYITKQDPVTDLPVVLLVNESSASASEIFAAAMQDYERAHLIGQKTFGKFVAQYVFNLDETTNAEVRFTVAKWYTPKGNLAPITPDDIIEGEEDQLNAAYQWLYEQ